MQKLPQGPAQHSSDETHSTTPATDAVAAVVSAFETASFDVIETSEVPVVAGAMSSDAATSVPSFDAAPPLTRRELRERERAAEARAAKVTPVAVRPAVTPVAVRPTVTQTPTGDASSRSLLFPKTPPADSARRAARAASRPEKVSRIRARKGVKSRSLRLAKSTHPGGKPTVAASATPSPSVERSAPNRVKRTILQNLASVGAMAGVGLILISTTVPANAFSRPDTSLEATQASTSTVTSNAKTQELEVAAVAAPTVTRDGFTVTSLPQQLAAREGNRLFTYTNDASGSIQWPFPGGSPITSGFGPRSVAGCGFCSTYHQGLDFTPGLGTAIHSIADGVVSSVSTSGALGNHVVIDHIVNGQKVQSVYAHMQYGSIQVATGELVTVGQQVGNVGSTGASTGPHLHLEIHLDGTPVDPFAWLEANAN